VRYPQERAPTWLLRSGPTEKPGTASPHRIGWEGQLHGGAMKRVSVLTICVGVIVAAFAATPADAYISKRKALQRTFGYAKVACNRDSHCYRYGANACKREPRGRVSCAAWNYEIFNRGRYACRKTLLYKNRYSRPRVISRGWRCQRGWNHGPR
jgi:hypothetical protein